MKKYQFSTCTGKNFQKTLMVLKVEKSALTIVKTHQWLCRIITINVFLKFPLMEIHLPIMEIELIPLCGKKP